MRYRVGGSLAYDDPTYIERQADEALYTALQQGGYCTVFNARQMGKSSLLVRTLHRLQNQDYQCATLDMSLLGTEEVKPQQWYVGIMAELCWQLDISLDVLQWWQEQSSLSYVHRLNRFIREILLGQREYRNICIFIDEIDSVLNLPFAVDDFLMMIRYCYNQRSLAPDFQRLTFALFGMMTPAELVQNKRQPSFNIGTPIPLTGFSLTEAAPLAIGLAPSPEQAMGSLQAILDWTGGQPFLTQKLCSLMATTSQSVATVVQESVINNWERQDEPEHLRTISNHILCHPYMTGRLLGIYQQVLLAEESLGRPSRTTEATIKPRIDDAAEVITESEATESMPVYIDGSPEQLELLLSGLVIKEGNSLRVKNPIYQAVFNPDWVARQLENLRPYAAPLQAWLDSEQTDHTQLLTDLNLQEALAWAQDKQLSDLDYRFLNASQRQVQQAVEQALVTEKAERQQIEHWLQITEAARELLEQARRQAKRQSQHYRLAGKQLAMIGSGVAIALLLLRLTGLLQPLEWAGLDLFFQQRPVAAMSDRVSILTIDEPDIQFLGQYPFSDQTLTRVLIALDQHQPRVIGLDIFRDLPVEPGHKAFTEQLQQMPHVIGIEKVVGTQIAPPPTLAETDRIGIADQIVDGDGRIRRTLLSLRHENQLRLGLALKLALAYLNDHGIQPERLANDQIQLGKAQLTPFNPNDGGYVRADAGGYQMLLNYRGTRAQFPTFSLRDLLSGNVDGDLIRNRIILIGAIAPTVNDLAATPYNGVLTPKRRDMAAVTIHANSVDQLVSAALDSRPLLRTWSTGYEWLSILLSAGLGAILGNLRQLRWISLSLVGAIFLLMIGAFLLFLGGWWIPWIPMVMGILIAATLVMIEINRQVSARELQQIMHYILATADNAPVTSKLALEYLNQGKDIKP
ncbi:MAG: CHASE2 domain-containing protein [Cyanobacteria bacterium P01_B01_bin.77]